VGVLRDLKIFRASHRAVIFEVAPLSCLCTYSRHSLVMCEVGGIKLFRPGQRFVHKHKTSSKLLALIIILIHDTCIMNPLQLPAKMCACCLSLKTFTYDCKTGVFLAKLLYIKCTFWHIFKKV